MGNYRPIGTDLQILARSKTKYYGAYPAGFLHRGRQLLGVHPVDAVLHVCAGKVREYPMRGLGEHDRTVDIDPGTFPDLVWDARNGVPCRSQVLKGDDRPCAVCSCEAAPLPQCLWPAIMIDRPYTEDDADHYATGRETLPPINPLTRAALLMVPMGHRVGVLDYMWPHPGKHGREVSITPVSTGRNSRMRGYHVFERIDLKE